MLFTTTELVLLVGLVVLVVVLAVVAGRVAETSERTLRDKGASEDPQSASPAVAPRGPRRRAGRGARRG
jgi:hypothetical protein